MVICRNCSQTFNSESTEKVESVDICPRCEEISTPIKHGTSINSIAKIGTIRFRRYATGVAIWKEED